MTTKHTPGPWKARTKTTRFAVTSQHLTVAHVIGLDAAAKADAHLIAAAPRLLAALAGMLAIVDDSQAVAGYHLNGELEPWDGFPEIEEARAAIAEATGESK